MYLVSDIDFNYSEKKTWAKLKNGFFCGSAFLGDKLLDLDDIRSIMYTICTIDDAVNVISTLNGHFALALEINDSIFLAVDRLRTIPLFYEILGSKVVIKNHISLDEIVTHGINDLAYKELDNCLFAVGNKTFARNVYSVMAGEYIVISSERCERRFYHELNSCTQKWDSIQSLFLKMDQLFCTVTQRLISYLNGRTAVIPLSGGHDSRLLAYYLTKCGYSNIVSYTYGPEGNVESATSQKVANYLGLEWYNIKYNPKQLQVFFKNNFEGLVDYCFNGVSSVCVQDWYAVAKLKQQNIIPKDSVFVPGHSFDFLSGGHILPRYIEKTSITQEELVNDILWKHCSEGKRILSPDRYEYYRRYITSEYLQGNALIFDNKEACCIYHNFNLRERQAKFICNQVRLYEYFGYDWFLPLWDSDLTDFWDSIDIRLKFNRQIFFEFTKFEYKELMLTAPVENEKLKVEHKVNMNPLVRVLRKINQLVNYVDYHYCLAYFTRREVISMFLPKGILNIGYFINNKIKGIVLRREQNG